MSKQEFEAFNRDYGADVAGELMPQMASHPSSSVHGTRDRTADMQVFKSRPDGHCSACVTVLSKLDDIISSLTALFVKLDTLENKLSTVCEKNAGLHT